MKTIILILAVMANASGQTPSFDAASIRPNSSGPGPSSMQVTAGHVSMHNVSLKKMLLNAYGIPDDRQYAAIGPDWLEGEHFDVEATFPADKTPMEMRTMLQTLLATRFKMTAHKEMRQLPNYTLTIAKGGPKIRADEAGQAQTSGGIGNFSATRIPMAHFADLLARVAGFAVIDGTGLPGVYTFTLKWDPAVGLNVGAADGVSSGPS
ncbi:MAG TPA: TIGR03435 family protein, partial [Acidobacteriaceae bacterium]|nr:TIGR03435 family protein [Acidobacteriaceae bacterium]